MVGRSDAAHQQAFVALLMSHQRRLWAYVYTLLGDRELSDECLQETNLVLWRKADEFKLGTSFSAWAMRVAFLQAKALRKRLTRERRHLSDEVIQQLGERAARHLAEDRIPALRDCLKHLSARQHEALRGYYGAGCSVSDLSAALGIAVGAAKSLLHRSRVQLHNCLRRKAAAEAST